MPDRLLDTNAISAAMEASQAFERYLTTTATDGLLLTSAVVEGELLFGISRIQDGRRRRALLRSLNGVLSRLDDILAVDRGTATRYGQLKARMFAQGEPMGENDLWIAASALDRGLTLVSRDAHFKRVHGLRVEDWH